MKVADDITIRIGGEAITLRPCLRFALRLERRPGSFGQLAREIMDGSLSAAVEIVRDHASIKHLETRLFEVGIETLQSALLRYVMALAGIDPDDAPAKGDGGKGKSQPFDEYLAGLYRIGTGWLGWTPETTLDATPSEITEAYRGRLDMLKAIFGSSEQADDKPSTITLDEKFKTAFGSFGTTKVKRKKGA